MNPRRLFLLAAAALIAGCYAELDWRELYWEQGGVKVMLPAKPNKSTREVVLAGEKVTMEMLQSQLSGMAFGIAHSPLPAQDRRRVLESARDGLLRNIDGRLVTEREVTVRGADAPGLEFSGEGVVAGTPMLVAARLVADEGRFYQLVFVGRKDRAEKADIPVFLDSLTLVR